MTPSIDDRWVPSRRVRWFVGVLLALLVAPGLVGFEAWPLTAWRLFSLARDATETRWEIEALSATGESTTLQLDEMALGYRNAQWVLVDLPGASSARRERVCDALLEGAREEVPDAVGLEIVRDRQRLVRERGTWLVVHAPEVVHRCDRPAGDEP